MRAFYFIYKHWDKSDSPIVQKSPKFPNYRTICVAKNVNLVYIYVILRKEATMKKLILLVVISILGIQTANAFTNCTKQSDCSKGYFCNYVKGYNNPNLKSMWHEGNDGDNRMPKPNQCQKLDYKIAQINGNTYYYNTEKALKSWCREATQGAPEDTPGNCNWGYLSWEGANNWCKAVGGHLLSKNEIEKIWDKFLTYKPPFGANPCYWTSTDSELWGIYNKQAYWCYGGKGKGGSTRKDGYWGAGAVICKIK